MNPSIKIEIRRALEWLTNMQKTLEKWQKKDEGERWNSERDEKYRKTFSCVQCMNYAHKDHQKWRWRVWLQSSQGWFWLTDRCVDENVNNGRLHIFQIWSWKVKERGVSERFVCYTAALADCNLLWKCTHSMIYLLQIHCIQTDKKYCNTMVLWDIYPNCIYRSTEWIPY